MMGILEIALWVSYSVLVTIIVVWMVVVTLGWNAVWLFSLAVAGVFAACAILLVLDGEG